MRAMRDRNFLGLLLVSLMAAPVLVIQARLHNEAHPEHPPISLLPISLFIEYESKDSEVMIHKEEEVCLPGGGWVVTDPEMHKPHWPGRFEVQWQPGRRLQGTRQNPCGVLVQNS